MSAVTKYSNLKYNVGKVGINNIMIHPYEEQKLKINNEVVCIEIKSFNMFSKDFIDLTEFNIKLKRIICSEKSDEVMLKELKDEIINFDL
jgi:hypothetical protein